MSLTGQQLQAAAFVAVGELTEREIAEKVGVTDRTLRNWKGNPIFAAEVEAFKAEAARKALEVGIANRQVRLKRLNARWDQIDRIFRQRASDPNHIGVPGHDTGLLAHEQRSIGGGELATVVDIYKADTPLLKEERELAKQAAIELGQWQEKQDVTSGGETLKSGVVVYIPSNGRDSTAGGPSD